MQGFCLCPGVPGKRDFPKPVQHHLPNYHHPKLTVCRCPPSACAVLSGAPWADVPVPLGLCHCPATRAHVPGGDTRCPQAGVAGLSLSVGAPTHPRVLSGSQHHSARHRAEANSLQKLNHNNNGTSSSSTHTSLSLMLMVLAGALFCLRGWNLSSFFLI